MTVVTQAREELVAAFNAIDGERGVTATRAFKAAEQAISDFDAQMTLLKWERERVERVAAQHADRERLAREERERFDAEVAKVEKRKARK